MKIFFQKHLLLLCAILSISFSISSCKKKSDDPAPVSVSYGTLFFHLHDYIDSIEVEDYNTNYTFHGRKMSLSTGQFYLSEITLVKTDGSTYTIKDTIKLKELESELYSIGNVPTGSYRTVRFNVGLPVATNALPSTANNALNHPEMWFGSSAQPNGYVFVNIAGKVDTTTAKNATDANMQPFSYLIGTNANLTTVTMPDFAYTIVVNQPTTIHMYADASRLFDGIQLNNSNNLTMNTVSANATALGQKLKNNVSGMFHYEIE